MSLEDNFIRDRAWRQGPGIPEGMDIEKAAFGLPDISKKDKVDGYLQWGEALKYAQEHQPNPLHRSPVASLLRKKVAALCIDTGTPVKFFTAVGTPLDTFHGVDAFFEQGQQVVTVDISARDKEHYKADVLLQASLDEDGKIKIEEQELSRVAALIAEKFQDGLRKNAA